MLNLIPAHENPFELLFVVFGYGYVMLHEVFQCHDVGSFAWNWFLMMNMSSYAITMLLETLGFFLNPENSSIGRVTVLLAESQSKHFVLQGQNAQFGLVSPELH